MKKQPRTIKIEVSKFPPININKNPLKFNVNIKKLEGILEIEGNFLTNPVIKKIIDSISKEAIELKITEIDDNVEMI